MFILEVFNSFLNVLNYIKLHEIKFLFMDFMREVLVNLG